MNKTLIIAEIGINHNGNLDLAEKLIDVASSAGCDFVKFQKRDIESCYTEEELNSPRESPWGKTFRTRKEGLEFSEWQYDKIDEYCRKRKIGWFASPWDLKSIDFLSKYEMPWLKVPSALITNMEFLEKCRMGIPIILSTGMSTLKMVQEAVQVCDPSVILHCTSTYPSKAEELNLRSIPRMMMEFPGKTIGFSNHSPGIIYMPVAVALGARVVEFHITLDRSMYGSDQAASIEPEGVFKVVKYIRGVESALGDGVKRIYPSEEPIVKKLRR
jgi:N-acetylneuraminate synthase